MILYKMRAKREKVNDFFLILERLHVSVISFLFKKNRTIHW